MTNSKKLRKLACKINAKGRILKKLLNLMLFRLNSLHAELKKLSIELERLSFQLEYTISQSLKTQIQTKMEEINELVKIYRSKASNLEEKMRSMQKNKVSPISVFYGEELEFME